jgi:hypothetical protein
VKQACVLPDRFMPIPRPLTAALALLFGVTPLLGRAQEMKTQPTPFTAWLDFRSIAGNTVAKDGLPIWVESVQRITAVAGKTTLRVRFRHLA